MKKGFTVLTVFVSALIGLAILEGSYRAYVVFADPARFEKRGDAPSFYGVYNQSLWEFDVAHGFRYPPGRIVNQTLIDDGRVVGCEILDIINENGNIGITGLRHTEPDFTIAVFGDSFTAFSLDGLTWPIFLQEALERRTGFKVNVINYGRDGYGVLQMLRLAIDKINEQSPDLALVAFISDDIDRAPIWRSEVRIEGRDRVLTSMEPTPSPSLGQATDTFVLHPKATAGWCKETKGRRDSVVEEIEGIRQDILSRGSETRPSPFTLKHSYIYNRLISGNPTHFTRRLMSPSQNPRLNVNSFSQLTEAMKLFKSIKMLDSPLQLVHLAFFPEVDSGREYILNPRQEQLLASLMSALDQAPLETLDYVKMPVEGAARMNASPSDFHPSIWGMKFYANAVANMILQNNLLAITAPNKPTD